MNLNYKLIEKMHEDAGAYSHISITRNWEDTIPSLKYTDHRFFDKLFTYDEFIHIAQAISNEELEDSYFSINSFRVREKKSRSLWHLNAFVLDFDYYQIDKYKNYDTRSMYEEIKSLLPLDPTAVVDSGRGMYIIYTFKHAAKQMADTYKAIYKSFYKKFKDFGMDSKAMNITQIIRIPGSFNSKSFTAVEVIEFKDTKYTIKDFFPLLSFSREEVSDYKTSKKCLGSNKHKEYVVDKQRSLIFKKEQARLLIEDFKKLILMRNERDYYEGYRETLIYLARKRLRWSGESLEKELEVAFELNSMMVVSLLDKEVKHVTAPYGNKRCCSIKRIIEKLNITFEEQQQLSYLREKAYKDCKREKRKRTHKLLNMTEKQIKMLKRRTEVLVLKNSGETNSSIARKLNVDKSTITNDLCYIKKHAWRFKKKLKDAMTELQANIENVYYVRRLTYPQYKTLSEWLKQSEIALE